MVIKNRRYKQRLQHNLARGLENAVILQALTETETQLSIDEQALGSLQTQSATLADILSGIETQVAIAAGQHTTLEQAVLAIYGTGTGT